MDSVIQQATVTKQPAVPSDRTVTFDFEDRAQGLLGFPRLFK